jgi:nucleoside phosphorylase
MGKIKITDALDKQRLNSFISKCEARTIFTIQHEIAELLGYWMGSPSIERIEYIICSYSYLEEFIDFQIVKSRLDFLEQFEKKEANTNKIFGVHLSKFLPELVVVRDSFENSLLKYPQGIKKAELWLYPIALNAGANADMEAAIYFASRSELLLDAQEIKTEWHRVICIDIERGRPAGNLPDAVNYRAKSRTISLTEASEILKFNGDLIRFFGFMDEEEDFIDATFFRAVEWFGVKGFEPWLESFARNLSVASQYGIDHIYSAWFLFFWCRSDLAIKKTNKFGLESYLYGLINGQLESDKPWKITWSNQNTQDIVDYIPTASIILFLWYRIKPTNLDHSILERATHLLFQTQLNSGGWPSKSNDSEASIISTCIAIHALSISKPGGWESLVKRAKEWLLKEQDEGGFWTIQGGPTVMLTVLVLDSIHLASGEKNVTFSLEGVHSKDAIHHIESDIEEPVFNYSNEEWFNSHIPDSNSISKNEAIKCFKPRIALVTALDIELIAVLKRLKPPKGKRKVWKVIDGGETYYLGRFGEFDTVIVMSNMGSQGISGSTLTIDSLIRLWDPTGVVLLGIAFGVNRKRHKVGDVLIANNIIPYEQQRVGEEIIYRNPIAPSSYELINRIRNTLDWDFRRPDNSKVDKHIGDVLSGEKLVDNIEFKNALIAQYPQVIGGEMEGSGLWASASRHKKSWILIKSVCDWGDGKKHKNYQLLAAASAVSLCEHIFKDKHSLDGMK